MNKTASEWYKVQLDHIDHIEIDHIEYLKRTIDWNGTQQSAVEIIRHVDELSQMGAKVLNKLDAFLLFFPELQVAICAAGNHEIRALFRVITFQFSHYNRFKTNYNLPSDYKVSYHISMHVTLLIVLTRG